MLGRRTGRRRRPPRPPGPRPALLRDPAQPRGANSRLQAKENGVGAEGRRSAAKRLVAGGGWGTGGGGWSTGGGVPRPASGDSELIF